MKIKFKILTWLLVMFSAPAWAQSVAKDQAIVSAGTDWSKPFLTRVDVSFSSSVFHARWDISRCDCGDVYILAEETLPGEIRKGEQLLLDSKVLLIKGYDSYEGPLAALMDSPMLMMQLLFVLLQHVEPAGPAAISGVLAPDISEQSRPLMLDSGVAYGAFPAPWSFSGTITPLTKNQFRYELDFGFNLEGDGQQTIELSGLLDYGYRAFPLDDSLLLDGWSAAWLDLKTENHEGLTPGMTLGKFKESMGSESSARVNDSGT
ncbi:MAG: hypothetical protein ACI9H8_002059 [Lysobacterales bacterium]|jgi:hypothetical protein